MSGVCVEPGRLDGVRRRQFRHAPRELGEIESHTGRAAVLRQPPLRFLHRGVEAAVVADEHLGAGRGRGIGQPRQLFRTSPARLLDQNLSDTRPDQVVTDRREPIHGHGHHRVGGRLMSRDPVCSRRGDNRQTGLGGDALGSLSRAHQQGRLDTQGLGGAGVLHAHRSRSDDQHSRNPQTQVMGRPPDTS